MALNDSFHPVAWLAWLAAAALPALSTRNPLYLSLVLLAAGVVYLALERCSRGTQPAGRSWGAFVRFGALLWLLTIPFTALTAHHGTLVLLRLPAAWPVVGGPITGEALLYGLTGGLALIGLLLVFATFNVAVDQARLLRMTPGFIYQVGVVASIAVAFVPQMVGAWQTIREVQQVRGHRVRGLRDLLPLIIPLLVTALERAVQLAESMEARGFGCQAEATPRRRTIQQLAVLAGLAAIAAGVAAAGFWRDRPWPAGVFLACGAGALLGSFWDQGRHVRRSRYRRWQWGRADRAVAVVSLLAGLAWAIAWLARPGWLSYYPYPPSSPWPTFQPGLGMAIAALALPGLLLQPAHKTSNE